MSESVKRILIIVCAAVLIAAVLYSLRDVFAFAGYSYEHADRYQHEFKLNPRKTGRVILLRFPLKTAGMLFTSLMKGQVQLISGHSALTDTSAAAVLPVSGGAEIIPRFSPFLFSNTLSEGGHL